MYKVLVDFRDLQDNGYRYHAGDVFPRKGIEPTKERFEELSTDGNRRGKPMIQEVEDIKEFIPEGPVKEPEVKVKKGGKKKNVK